MLHLTKTTILIIIRTLGMIIKKISRTDNERKLIVLRNAKESGYERRSHIQKKTVSI